MQANNIKKAAVGAIVIASIPLCFLLTELTTILTPDIEKTSEMPCELVQAILNGGTIIAQHGYTHAVNLTDEEKILGYRILVDYGLIPQCYTAPEETLGERNHPFLPTEMIVIALSTSEDYPGCVAFIDNAESWESFKFRPENISAINIENLSHTTIMIHIQDPITVEMLDSLNVSSYDLLRVDDVNTDVFDVSTQILRIKCLSEYCREHNIPLMLSVIPCTQRSHLPAWTSTFNLVMRIMVTIGFLLLIPSYTFYFSMKWLM